MATIRQRGWRLDRRGHHRVLQRRRLAAVLTAALWSAAAPQALAQERGGYAGGALGQARFTEWCDTGGSPVQLARCDDTTTAWKVFGGYRFNPYLGAELTYFDWGKVDATVGTASVSAKQTSYGVAAVGSVPVGGGVSLQAKLGFLRTDQETASPSGRADRGDTETHYGVGVRYAFPGPLALRAEWERTEKLEVQLLSIGAEYRF